MKGWMLSEEQLERINEADVQSYKIVTEEEAARSEMEREVDALFAPVRETLIRQSLQIRADEWHRARWESDVREKTPLLAKLYEMPAPLAELKLAMEGVAHQCFAMFGVSGLSLDVLVVVSRIGDAAMTNAAGSPASVWRVIQMLRTHTAWLRLDDVEAAYARACLYERAYSGPPQKRKSRGPNADDCDGGLTTPEWGLPTAKEIAELVAKRKSCDA